MKLKRLLTTSLLFGSLLLSSCNMLLPKISGKSEATPNNSDTSQYSDYVPGEMNFDGQPKVLSVPEGGKRISYSEFANAYANIKDYRKEYNYANINILNSNVYGNDGYVINGYLVYNRWQFSDSYGGIYDASYVNEVMITDTVLEDYYHYYYGRQVEFYYNSNAREYYVLEYNTDRYFYGLDEMINTYDMDFYLTQRVYVYNEGYQTTFVNWDNNNQHEYIPMTIFGRKFRGIAFYSPYGSNSDVYEEYAINCTVSFDINSNVEFVFNKQLVNDQIIDSKQYLYGNYQNEPNNSNNRIDLYIKGDGLYFENIEDRENYSYSYSLDNSFLYILFADDYKMTLEYIAPCNDIIEFPQIREKGEGFRFDGQYTFDYFTYISSGDNYAIAAEEYIHDYCETAKYENNYFYINYDRYVTFVYDGSFGFGHCIVSSGNIGFTIVVDYYVDTTTFVRYPGDNNTIYCTFVNDSSFMIEIYSDEGFIVYAVYQLH